MTGSKFSLTGSLTDSQLARLVLQVKNTIGITTEELASRIGRPVTVVVAWEGAEVRPSDADVSALAAQCGVTGEALVLRVQAFSIDRAMGILHVGGSTAYVDPLQGNEHVLATYMSLVRNMRMSPDDGPVELRSHDLDVLADYLDLHDVALVEQLAQAARVTHEEAHELRRLLLRRPILASVAGLLAGGLATFGVAGRVLDDRPVTSPPAVVTTAVPTPASPITSSPSASSPGPPATLAAATPAAAVPTPASAPAATTAAPAATRTSRPMTTKTTRPTTATTAPPTDIGDAVSVTNPSTPVSFPPIQP